MPLYISSQGKKLDKILAHHSQNINICYLPAGYTFLPRKIFFLDIFLSLSLRCSRPTYRVNDCYGQKVWEG